MSSSPVMFFLWLFPNITRIAPIPISIGAKNEGFITEYEVNGDLKKTITITLKYTKGNQKVISGVKRISKPGLRIYAQADKLPRVLNGLGIAIISTSHGLLTDKEAKAKHVGGEVVAYVW